MLKSLWASVQGDPVFMRRVNGWLTLFWIFMIPVSFITHWIDSVTYVSVLSLWALVSGHWAAWQAARVEVKQDEATDTSGDVRSDGVRCDPGSGVRSVPSVVPERPEPPTEGGDVVDTHAVNEPDPGPAREPVGRPEALDPLNSRSITGNARPGALTDAAAANQAHADPHPQDAPADPDPDGQHSDGEPDDAPANSYYDPHVDTHPYWGDPGSGSS